LSLDKWIEPEKKKGKGRKKPEDHKRKTKIQKSKIIEESEDSKTINIEEKPLKNYQKYILICSKKTCNYQKTIVKKELNKKDKICPRCKSTMKIEMV
jgi:hypothetical protein